MTHRRATLAICGFLLAVAAGLPAGAAAQTGAVRGTVVAAADSTPLSGAVVRLVPVGRRGGMRRVVCDAQGAFLATNLQPGAYEIRITVRGFQPVTNRIDVRPGETVDVPLRLDLLPLREELRVEPGDPALADRLTAIATVPAHLVDVVPIAGDSFAALMPLLPGVIRQPDGRLSLAGGRPEQSGLQVSDASVTDPVTGGYGIELPIDAVESVTRFASPYAAEYGRFSSGLVRIETRRSDNEWRTSVSSFTPAPRVHGGKLRGLSSFSPRLLIGGPLVRDRLFLTQSLQYEMRTTRVPSLPDPDNLHELERASSFTRLDAEFGDSHDLTATLAVFPRDRRFVTLDTFTPASATPDVRERGFQVDILEQTVIGRTLLVSSEFSARRYDVDIVPQEDGVMTLATETRTGAFFHREARESRSYQWIQAVTRSVDGRFGTHLVKAGLDLLHASYQGVVDRGPVEIRRSDGTLAERIEFPGAAAPAASGTDVALFVQDRWRVNDRLAIEAGLRLDRDGVVRQFSWSPRASLTAGILPSGRGILRGGAGVFALRSPLNVATFEALEPRVVTRFAADGLSPAAPATTWLHESRIDEVPRGVVWSIGYDQRVAGNLVVRVNHLRRDGLHEFVVNPAVSNGQARLVLSSDGRSDYMETEVTAAYGKPQGLEAVVSYVRARADGDFNHFDRFFGDLPVPVVRANARGRFDIDVPRRLIFRGTLPLQGDRWHIGSVVEVRSGFPYSAFDESLEFVGAPNGAGRFPALAIVDVAVSRQIRVKGKRLLIGIRAYNTFNRFTPRDVQQHLASPGFGSFYNGIERRVSLLFQVNPPGRPRD